MRKTVKVSVLVAFAFGLFLSISFPLPLLPDSPFFLARAERSDSLIVLTSTREGRLAVFDDAWSAINERYYDRKFNGLDWDAQKTAYRSLAAAAI